MGDVELIELAVAAARARDRARVEALLSPHFFARLANGRIIIGPDGLTEAVSYGSAVAAPSAEPFSDLEPVGGGFVVSHEHRFDTSALAPGAWLLHVRDRRLHALLHFPSAEEAVNSMPPHMRELPPAQLVGRVIAASNDGDLATLVGMLASDYELVALNGDVVRGVPAVLDLHQMVDETYEYYATVAERIEELRDGDVLVVGRIESRTDGHLTASPQASRVSIRNGLVTRWVTYASEEEARAASAAPPPQ